MLKKKILRHASTFFMLFLSARPKKLKVQEGNERILNWTKLISSGVTCLNWTSIHSSWLNACKQCSMITWLNSSTASVSQNITSSSSSPNQNQAAVKKTSLPLCTTVTIMTITRTTNSIGSKVQRSFRIQTKS